MRSDTPTLPFPSPMCEGMVLVSHADINIPFRVESFAVCLSEFTTASLIQQGSFSVQSSSPMGEGREMTKIYCELIALQLPKVSNTIHHSLVPQSSRTLSICSAQSS